MAILLIQHSRHSEAGHLGESLRSFGQRVRAVHQAIDRAAAAPSPAPAAAPRHAAGIA
jgi:hypothetical protein